MRKTLLGLIVVGGLLAQMLVVFAAPAPADWPGWRGAARDGKSPDTGLLKEWPAEGPRLLWKTTGVGAGFSTVAVTGGRIYTSGILNDEFTALGLSAEGQILWRTPLGPESPQHPGARSTPVVDEGLVYLVTAPGLVACLDAATGARRWTRQMSEFGGQPPNWQYAESPLLYKNLAIITPGGQNCIVALDKKTGQTVWQSSGFRAPAHYGSCLLAEFQGVPMVIAGTGGGLFAVDARDGSLLWSSDFAARNTANCPTPAYADGYVFWANGYRKGGVCLKLSMEGGKVTAQEAWRTLDMDCHHGGYILKDGFVYGNHAQRWSCLDLKSGEVKWSQPGVGKGSACYADGMLYLFGERNGAAGLASISPAGMEMKGQFSVQGTGQSWAHPVVIGGRLYLRYDDNLYCFDVRAGRP